MTCDHCGAELAEGDAVDFVWPRADGGVDREALCSRCAEAATEEAQRERREAEWEQEHLRGGERWW
jgi:hypothetical protein